MFVYLLSSALEKHAPLKKEFLMENIRIFSKRLGLTRNAETYYVIGSWPTKSTPRNYTGKLLCLEKTTIKPIVCQERKTIKIFSESFYLL